jgi:predicted protein tyrosine phosphatase
VKVLFVCARNKRRSKTAHEMFRRDRRMSVRSAGFSPQSPHQIGARDVAWADVVFVMEEEHSGRLRRDFRDQTLPEIVVLHIPDEYAYMEEELVGLLQSGVDAYFERG